MRRGKRISPTQKKTEHTQPIFFMGPSHYSSYEFSPRDTLEGKQNFGRNIFIEPDGTVKEVVRLNVLDDRHREDLIAYHFCMQYAEILFGRDSNQPEFFIVGRDDPWDYRYVMHDGSRFNVEICRVASEGFLKALKAENDCSKLLQRPYLEGFEILKIERHFPGLFPDELVTLASSTDGKKRLFSNTNVDTFQQAFIRSPFDPRVDLKSVLRREIEKKAAKRNKEKDETHLILDNLTTHETPLDFFEAFSAISDLFESVPFMCIWLYTGYYSDNDGKTCEFSLMPIKLSEQYEEKLHSFLGR